MTKNTSYLKQAAKHSDYNIRHWLRYLRKFASPTGLKLTSKETDYLMHTNDLHLYQKVILQRAVVPNSITHKYLLYLNRPASTPIYDAVRHIKNKEK